MQKTIVYCRVSTEEQKEKGISLDAQERTCCKKAEEMGLKSIEVIRDEGKSGGSLNRSGIQRIIEMSRNKEFDTLLTIHSNRLARNTEDHLMLRRIFKENGVKVLYVFQPDLGDNTAIGKTMDTVVAAFNEMQRNIIKEKTMDALRQKALEGWFPGLPPLGYKTVENPRHGKGEISKRIIIPDPETAPLITKLFKLYATGNYNVYDLVDILYREGLRSKKGGRPAYSKIYESLRNPLYVGEIHWGDVNIRKANHKPLTDKWTFRQVQLIIDGHNHHACRKRKFEFVLRGFVYCARCGRRLTAEWHTKKSGLKFSYYHCPQRIGCSRIDYIKTDELEKQVEEKFKDIQLASEVIERLSEKLGSVLKDRRNEINRQKRALYNQKKATEIKRDALEDKLLNGVISDGEFARMREKIGGTLDVIQDQLDAMEKNQEIRIDELQEILSFAKNIYETYKNAPYPLKRHFLAFFWNRFEIENKKIANAKMTDLFEALLQTGNAVMTPQTIAFNPVCQSQERELVSLRPQRGGRPDLNRRSPGPQPGALNR